MVPDLAKRGRHMMEPEPPEKPVETQGLRDWRRWVLKLLFQVHTFLCTSLWKTLQMIGARGLVKTMTRSLTEYQPVVSLENVQAGIGEIITRKSLIACDEGEAESSMSSWEAIPMTENRFLKHMHTMGKTIDEDFLQQAMMADAAVTKNKNDAADPPDWLEALFEVSPICNCGKPATLQVTQKPGVNHLRTFWSCGHPTIRKCQFFAWTRAQYLWAPAESEQAKQRDLQQQKQAPAVLQNLMKAKMKTCQHLNTTTAGSNGYTNQLKCKDCGQILEKSATATKIISDQIKGGTPKARPPVLGEPTIPQKPSIPKWAPPKLPTGSTSSTSPAMESGDLPKTFSDWLKPPPEKTPAGPSTKPTVRVNRRNRGQPSGGNPSEID